MPPFPSTPAVDMHVTANDVMRVSRAAVVAALVAAGCGGDPSTRGGAFADAAAVPGSARAQAQRALADIVLAADTTVVSARLAAGTTLASMLRAQHVVASDVTALVRRAGQVFDLRKMRRDQPYRLETTAEGVVRRLDYEIDRDRVLRVARASPDDELVATVLPIPKSRQREVVRARVDRAHPSLVAAMDQAGETLDLTLALADIFGAEIDFSTEVQPGDRIELSVEKEFRDDGRFAGYGPIDAAEFINAGRHVRAVRFAPDGGRPDYYDERGVSMRRFFLASPLKFQPVVTSAFSRSRLHPVLREYRAHLGVDYRAAAGAPVVAVADGVVVSAGFSGGSGNMVHLRHANGFETQYLHLSSVAVRAGAHVRQGEFVGRVGSTGLATGPHLDYRVKKNGLYVNPITAHRSMPPPDPIPAGQMTAFSDARDRAFAALAASPARVANRDATVK
jgi:murein DD-endopeptidase MepM/ murein hydrolase activator NlpD